MVASLPGLVRRNSTAGSVGCVLRLLFTRRWLIAVLVAIVFCVACVFLGRWQWGRYENRRTQADLVETHYGADPVPLSTVLPAGAATLPDDQVWRRVVVTGRYAAEKRQLVRNRPQNVTYGYEVLDPLVLPDGGAVLVDRGWVPNAERADVLPQVPPPPNAEVRVVGWLRQGEPALQRDMPAGQLASIDLGAAGQATGLELRPAYLILDSERTADGATPERPQPLLPPRTDTGPHLAYAIQWWGAAPVGFVLVFVYLRREYRDSREDSGASSARRGASAPKKVRIWDEEDG